MTFLNPALLWGLLALAVPIIVHFFNLRRPRQVLFSNIALVKSVRNTVVRRLQFQRWLLLLARLLALAALVLAFANPVIIEPGTAALQGNRSVAIVIDNSYSMSAGNERGEYFQQSISLARNIIRAYGRQDEFLVMGTDDLKLTYNFSGAEEALESLRELSISQNIRSHDEILSLRDQLFDRASNQVRELYFLSDFQQSTVLADSQQLVLSDSTLLIKYLPLATRDQQNVYPAEHRIRSQILEKEKPVELSMDLVNDGNRSISDLSVRVILGGKAAAIDNTSLEPNEQRQIDLTFTPTESGWLSGYIELDDNPIDFDNRRYFSLYVPEKEKVLVVEGQPSRNIRILYESLFAEQFETTFVSFRDLSTVQINDYRSLVLLGITQLSTGLSDRLQRFINEGGSLMAFPGAEPDLSSLNSFYGRLGIGRLGPAVSFQEGKAASGVDLQHPIFRGVFSRDQDRRSFDAPQVYKYHPLELNNNAVQNRIMTLENQDPILLESRVGEGLVFTFTVFPGDAWTDLHVKSIFTPIMFRATQVMNQTQNVEQGQEIGFFEPKRIRTDDQALINLVAPEGQVITPEQYSQSGATTLNFEKMDLSEGNYDIVQEGELLEKIAFNISDLESQLDYLERTALRDRLGRQGYGRIEVLAATPDSVSARIETEKTGTPLWKYFIVAALLCLLTEVLILKFSQRSETTPV
jgi:hypothetical protein